MQSLATDPFAKLIPLLPVENHAVLAKASNWEKCFRDSGLESEFRELFKGSKEIRLTRADVRSEILERRKCIKILLWGYPSGMQGNRNLSYLKNLGKVVQNASSDANWRDYFSALNGIGGLGISTISKIAYFFDRSFGGHKALILDSRLIGVIAGNRWIELSGLECLSYQNADKNYQAYLELMSAVAGKIEGAEPEHLEFFLFTLGGAFSNVERTIERVG